MGNLNMSPCLSKNYSSNVLESAVELFCKQLHITTAFGQFSYFKNFSVIKLMIPRFFSRASSISSASLFNHILSIVFRRTKKQMPRINTISNIAGVTYKHSFWDFANINFIRNSVRSSCFSRTKLSVAFCMNRPSPKPTAISFIKYFSNLFFIIYLLNQSSLFVEVIMGASSILPQGLDPQSTFNRWATILSPWLGNPMSKGIFLKDVALINGVTTINHLLQRKQQGYFITDQNAAASIYRSQPFNGLTLTLTSNAAVTVSLFVF